MSVPIRIKPVEGGYYDDTNGVCYAAPAPICGGEGAPVVESSYSPPTKISRSVLLADAFGNASRLGRPSAIWRESAMPLSPLGAFASLAACGNDPVDPGPVPGDPIADVSALGPEFSMSGSLAGKIRGIALSSAGNRSAVLWSVIDSAHLEDSGTYAYFQSGTSSGSLSFALPDESSIHLSTHGSILDNGETVAVYTRYTGEEEPTSLVARRLSSTGISTGGDIQVLPAAVHATAPEGQVVPLSSGFIVVFKDGEGHLGAVRYDAEGAEVEREADLGPAPKVFHVARGEGDSWVLAEIQEGDSDIRVRSFDGIDPTGADTTVSTGGFPSSPVVSIAMQDDGSTMLAWNVATGGIRAALLSPAGSPQGESFPITTSGTANTVSLASDHRGNFVLAYEQAGEILARIYNGTSNYENHPGLAVISNGNNNSDIQASVSTDGVLSLVWLKASEDASGNVLQDIARRNFRITYE